MAIKRYYANADNTITNAYGSSLVTRGTGSNMGEADVLEVFSIYGQQSAGSEELSRILIKFPIEDITADRNASNIPASGKVNFYLKMYNAEHSRTLPKNFKLAVLPISASWQEGSGLDMEEYTDITHDHSGSNWINANNNFVSASATLTALSKTAGAANSKILTVADSAGNSVNFQIDNSTSTSTATKIAFANANSNANQFATNIAAAVNAANTAETLNVVASADSATVTLTQTALGLGGNSASNLAGTAVSDSVVTVVSQFGGGDGQWATQGGDFWGDDTPSYEQTFSKGNEDLEIDVTTLVEEWIVGTKANYGFGIKLSSSYEAYSATNTIGATKSYYTKKFFARSSEFFFERPVIEARWNSCRKDDRENFYFSSSLAPGPENINTLYLYNYIRGRLRDIGGNSSLVPVMRLYYSSGSLPEGNAIGFKNTSNATVTHLSASRQEQGVYYAKFAVISSVINSTYQFLHDVWSLGDNVIHTGSAISPKKFKFNDYNPDTNYVLKISNLKKKYTRNQTERFRLYVREKNWSPSIYSKAKTTPDTLMIQSASYQISRMSDSKIVIPYNTGSDDATMLSYDKKGNYFDLDMDLLEAGYSYGIRFSFYEDSLSSYREQPYLFKFRVEKDEY